MMLERQAAERALDRQETRANIRPNSSTDAFKIHIEPLGDKEDVDAYLDHFESIARLHGWPEDIWALRLIPLLKGIARDSVRKIPQEELGSYQAVKKTILNRFNKSAEYFRRAF